MYKHWTWSPQGDQGHPGPGGGAGLCWASYGDKGFSPFLFELLFLLFRQATLVLSLLLSCFLFLILTSLLKVRAKLGPLLAKHTPGDLNKFFFTLGGAEANENAIKFAKVFTGRSKIMARFRSYHGATHAAMSLTGDARRWAIEPGNMSGIVRLFDPDPYRSLLYREGDTLEEFGERMLEQMEETIKYENPDSIAAILLESVTGWFLTFLIFLSISSSFHYLNASLVQEPMVLLCLLPIISLEFASCAINTELL